MAANAPQKPEILHDITGLSGLDQKTLAQMHALGVAVGDTETTGLKAGKNGLTELACVRCMTADEIAQFNQSLPSGFAPIRIKGNNTYHLVMFHSFVLPQKPWSQDFIPNNKKNARDLATNYEYAINAEALKVTGTTLVRGKDKQGHIDFNQPICDLEITTTAKDGTQNRLPARDAKAQMLHLDNANNAFNPLRFDQLMDVFLQFTKNGDMDAYYNAPFDKPFLADMIRDVLAYRQIKDQADYRYASPEQRDQLIDKARQNVIVPEGYTDPTKWRCVLHDFYIQHPLQTRHNLDSFAQMYVFGDDHTQRSEHSAIEDILLATRGMLALSTKQYDGKTHPLSELVGLATARLPAHAVSSATQTADGSSGIHVSISNTQGSNKSKAHTHWVKSMADISPPDRLQPARNRDSRPYFSAFSLTDGKLDATLISKDKRPRFLSIIKRNALAVELLKEHGAWIGGLAAYDRGGSYVDVTLTSGKTVTDVPWTALRTNASYLAVHQDQAPALLTLLRDILAQDARIGSVVIEGDAQDRKLVLRGHARGFGSLSLPWPASASIDDMRTALFATPKKFSLSEETQLQLLCSLGVIPFGSSDGASATIHTAVEEEEAERDELESEVKNPKGPAPLLRSTVNLLAPDQPVELIVNQKVYDLVRCSLPKGVVLSGGKKLRVEPKTGTSDDRYITRNTHGDSVILSGTDATFNTPLKSDDARGLDTLSSMTRDAAWLLQRLKSIPGTYDVQVDRASNRVILHQQDGVHQDALQLLHEVEIPYSATRTSISLPASYLMANAFHWSLGLVRAQEKMEKVALKPYEQRARHEHLKEETIVPVLTRALRSGRMRKLTHAPLIALEFIDRDGHRIRIDKDHQVADKVPEGRLGVHTLVAMMEQSNFSEFMKDGKRMLSIRITPFEHSALQTVLKLHPDRDAMVPVPESPATPYSFDSDDSANRKAVKTGLKLRSQLMNVGGVRGFEMNQFSYDPRAKTATLSLSDTDAIEHFLRNQNEYDHVHDIVQWLKPQTAGSTRSATHQSATLSSRIVSLIGLLPAATFDDRRPVGNTSPLYGLMGSISSNLKQISDVQTHLSDFMNKELAAVRDSHLFEQEKRTLQRIIRGCDSMIEKESQPEEVRKWQNIRQKAQLVDEKLANAIFGITRLEEAVSTVINRIAANGSGQRNRSLLGALVNAQADMLDERLLNLLKRDPPPTAAVIQTNIEGEDVALRKLARQAHVPEIIEEESVLDEWIEDAWFKSAKRLIVQSHRPFSGAVKQGLGICLERAFPNCNAKQREAVETFLTQAAVRKNASQSTHYLDELKAGAFRPEIPQDIASELHSAWWEIQLAKKIVTPEEWVEHMRTQPPQARDMQALSRQKNRLVRQLRIAYFYDEPQHNESYREAAQALYVGTPKRGSTELRTEEDFEHYFKDPGMSDPSVLAEVTATMAKREALLKLSADEISRSHDPDALLLILDRKEAEDRYLYLRQINEKAEDSVIKRASDLVADPEGTRQLHHSRILIRANMRLKEELVDLQKIQYHVSHDLEEAITLMQPQSAAQRHRKAQTTDTDQLVRDIKDAFRKLKSKSLQQTQAALESIGVASPLPAQPAPQHVVVNMTPFWQATSLSETDSPWHKLGDLAEKAAVSAPKAEAPADLLVKLEDEIEHFSTNDFINQYDASHIDLHIAEFNTAALSGFGTARPAKPGEPVLHPFCLMVDHTPVLTVTARPENREGVIKLDVDSSLQTGQLIHRLLSYAAKHYGKKGEMIITPTEATAQDRHPTYQCTIPAKFAGHVGWAISLANRLGSIGGVDLIADEQSHKLSIRYKPAANPDSGKAMVNAINLIDTLIAHGCAPKMGDRSPVGANLWLEPGKGFRLTELVMPPFPVLEGQEMYVSPHAGQTTDRDRFKKQADPQINEPYLRSIDNFHSSVAEGINQMLRQRSVASRG